MLKYINYQLDPDDAAQAQLEQAISSQINQRYTSNTRAFTQYIPSVVSMIEQHAIQQFSIFCTCKGELNIVDFATGRVWYSDSPFDEVADEVQSFCQQAPFIDLNSTAPAEKTTWQTEPLPASVDAVLMFGLGLGYQLNELLQNVRVKYLVVYEPSLDALVCTMQANDWQQLFETAAALGTQIFLQLGNDGSSVPEDLAELLQAEQIKRVYLYRHRFHPVMDKVLNTLHEHSGNRGVLTNSSQHFSPYTSFYDYVPERAGNTLGNAQFKPAVSGIELFEANMAALKRYYPTVHKVVLEHKCAYWSLVNDQCGQLNLLHNERQGLFYQHLESDSEQLVDYFINNPFKDDVILGQKTGSKLADYHHFSYVKKLQIYISQIIKEKGKLPEQVESLIIFGVGLGKHIELLTERRYIKNLYICEPNLDFFVHSLYVTDWALIFDRAKQQDLRIYLNLGGDGSSYFTDLMLQFYKVGAYSIANTYMLSSYFNENMQKAIYDLRSQLRVVLALGEYFDHVRFGIAHTHFSVKNHYFLRRRWQSNSNSAVTHLPIFVVGNGPSLDHCFDYLRQYREQVIIISCGTALRSLHRNGIQPDFHAEVEQNRATYDWITQVNDTEYLKGIFLLSVNGIHPDTAGLFKQTLLAFKQGESSTYLYQGGLKRLNAQADIASLKYAYPTVTNLVMNYMLTAGFKLFYLFGVDLGYVDIRQHHSKYSAYYKQDGKEVYDYQKAHGGGIPSTGNFRPVVFTKTEFDVSRKLLEQALVQADKTVEVYNCSDGVKIAGTITLAPDNILLPPTNIDKTVQINLFAENAYYPAFGSNADEIYSKLDLSRLKQSVTEWLAMIADDVTDKDTAKAIIEKQWQYLRQRGLDSSDLCFYLFYGSSNYVLGILTKLMAGIGDEASEFLAAFNAVLALWRSYLSEGLDLYLAEPLRLDGVSVSNMFQVKS